MGGLEGKDKDDVFEGESNEDSQNRSTEYLEKWREYLRNDPFINSEPRDFGVETDSGQLDKYLYDD